MVTTNKANCIRYIASIKRQRFKPQLSTSVKLVSPSLRASRSLKALTLTPWTVRKWKASVDKTILRTLVVVVYLLISAGK